MNKVFLYIFLYTLNTEIIKHIYYKRINSDDRDTRFQLCLQFSASYFTRDATQTGSKINDNRYWQLSIWSRWIDSNALVVVHSRINNCAIQSYGTVLVKCDPVSWWKQMALTLKFSKSEADIPWGFRLVGGVDFDQPVVVVKVEIFLGVVLLTLQYFVII